MRKIVGIALIVLGSVLIYSGWTQESSLAGRIDSLGTRISNSLDGGGRSPAHTTYLVGGIVLVIVGLVLAVRPAATPK